MPENGSAAVPAPANRAAIELDQVWAAYEQADVLEDVSLAIYEGEFVALIGPNGGGKTTLLKLLIGLLAPLRGNVQVLGRDVVQARRELAYVPQDIHFDRDFPVTAREVVRMGRLGRRGLLQGYTHRDGELADLALSRVGMEHLSSRPIGSLSGGERQRVYIARALASQPQVLLLDEPLANVDPGAREMIQDAIASLAHHLTIVMSSHDVGTLLPRIDRIGYLNRTLVYLGPPSGAPSPIRERYRCPAEAAADEFSGLGAGHMHEGHP